MKVAYCNPLDTPLPPGPGAINHQSCVCVWACWVLIQILDNIWSQLYKTRYQWPNAFKKVNCKHGMILITVTAQIYLHFPIQFWLTFCLEFFKYNLKLIMNSFRNTRFIISIMKSFQKLIRIEFLVRYWNLTFLSKRFSQQLSFEYAVGLNFHF